MTDLREGDAVIGADNSEYLVESVEWQENNVYRVFAVREDGTAMSTAVGGASILKVVPQRLDFLEEAPHLLFGMKWCDRCQKKRSRARYWEDDDYVCMICREELNLTHIVPD